MWTREKILHWRSGSPVGCSTGWGIERVNEPKAHQTRQKTVRVPVFMESPLVQVMRTLDH